MPKDWKTVKEVLKVVINSLQSLINEDEEQTEPEVVEKAVAITLPEIRAVLAEVSRNGRTAEVKALLNKYKANKLSEVKEEDYPALMEDAKVMQDAS